MARPSTNGKHAGRHRIQRAQVPHFARVRQTPHAIDNVVRGETLGLVDNNHSIHKITSVTRNTVTRDGNVILIGDVGHSLLK